MIAKGGIMRVLKFSVILTAVVWCLNYQFLVLAQEDIAPVVSEALNMAQGKAADSDEEGQDALFKSQTQKEMPADKVDKDGRFVIDSLELKGMDILDVLKLISKKSGLNIVAGNNVRGRITIYLKNVDVWDALRIILETNSLAYERIGNIVKVITEKDYEAVYGRKFSDKTKVNIVPLEHASSADLVPLLTQMKSVVGKILSDDKSNTIVIIDTPSKLKDMRDFIKTVDIPISTKIFNLNYSKVDDLKERISGVLTKNVGSINIDERTNKMVVRDTPAKLKEIESIVSAFDERHREVLIEAKIVQVTLSDQYKMGIDWQYLSSKNHNLQFENSFDILTSTEKFGKLSVGTLDPDEYEGFLELLDTIGTTNTLSNPHITALNNEEAKILVGSNEPYVTTTTTTTASGPTTTSESVNFIEVGVKLFVTPTISEDDFITMRIRPEISSVNSYLTTSENNQIPIVETSEAETRVMVKDGTTIVIAGLMKDENIKTVKKIPLLGDIPIIGMAFRNKDDLVRKTETIIFLTPHIISGEADSFRITEMPDFFKAKGY
jgi:MSHA type pilus biogenesis protein MshL